MLVLRLLVMVLSVICLMDGHTNVSSSTTGIKSGESSPEVKLNNTEEQILDRKKKKPKKGKKPNKGKKPKKKKPSKPVTTQPAKTTMTTSGAPTTTSTAKTTTSIVTTSTAKTTTSTVTTNARITTTIKKTTATTATTASSGEGGECKATNGKSCVFPFKDGNKEYNECKDHGGKYYWCATKVYESGKYMYWSYCPKDGSCPLPGEDKECKATNKKTCVFPFKDGNNEYNECADFNGKYFWCATGTNSAGKYTSWEKCPKDGSCPLQGQSKPPMTTPTTSTASTTTETSATATAIANVENTLNEINDTLQSLETADFTNDEEKLLETMTDLNDYLKTSKLTRSPYDPVKINYWSQQLYSTTAKIKETKQISSGFFNSYQSIQSTCSNTAQKAKLSEVNVGDGRMFILSTVTKIGTVRYIYSSSDCCSQCQAIAADSQLFEFFKTYYECDCYKTMPGDVPKTISSSNIDSGICGSSNCEDATKSDCPSGHIFVKGGFLKIPNDSRVLNIDTTSVKTKCDCRHFCDIHSDSKDKKDKCIAFLFNTCSENKEPKCILLNEDEPDIKGSTGNYLKYYAFCKRERIFVLKSNGESYSLFHELMGLYKLSEEVLNKFPLYKQLHGPGVAYVEPSGKWAVVDNKYLTMGKAYMYSGNHQIVETPPTTLWYYTDGIKWMHDSTLTMISIDSEQSVSKSTRRNQCAQVGFGAIKIYHEDQATAGYSMYAVDGTASASTAEECEAFCTGHPTCIGYVFDLVRQQPPNPCSPCLLLEWIEPGLVSKTATEYLGAFCLLEACIDYKVIDRDACVCDGTEVFKKCKRSFICKGGVCVPGSSTSVVKPIISVAGNSGVWGAIAVPAAREPVILPSKEGSKECPDKKHYLLKHTEKGLPSKEVAYRHSRDYNLERINAKDTEVALKNEKLHHVITVIFMITDTEYKKVGPDAAGEYFCITLQKVRVFECKHLPTREEPEVGDMDCEDQGPLYCKHNVDSGHMAEGFCGTDINI